MIEKNRTERKGLRERIFARGHLSLSIHRLFAATGSVLLRFIRLISARALIFREYGGRGERRLIYGRRRECICARIVRTKLYG